MKFGVVRFPGSCDEVDALLAAQRVGEAVILWHQDTDLQGVDAVIVPGGFSYGDYLRVGAIARFAPIMGEVERFARHGGLVLGICNGFQVLCEAGLLLGRAAAQHVAALRLPPGRARGRQRLDPVDARLRGAASGCRSRPSTRPAATTRPTRCWTSWRPTTRSCCATRPARTSTAPRATSRASATRPGNVLGLMPHPEHAVDVLTGSVDGLKLIGAAA